MKKIVIVLIAIIPGTLLMAQEKKADSTKENKKDKSIIIKKMNNGKDRVTVLVEGDKVIVNGVPIEEFKDDELEIIRNKGYKLSAPAFKSLNGLEEIMEMEDFMPHAPARGFSVPPSNKALLGVSTTKAEKGVKVVAVSDKSAADKAGLKEGDIITKVGDKAITTPEELHQTIGSYKPNDTVNVTYMREGKTNTTTVTLGRNTAMRIMGWNYKNDYRHTPDNYIMVSRKPKLGLQVQDVEEGTGVKILMVEEETPAAKAGLKQDDIITELDGKELQNVDELRTKLKEVKEGDVIKVKYKRGNKTHTTEVKLPKKLKTATL